MPALSVTCPSCQAVLKLPEKFPPGAKARCTKCSTTITLPSATSHENTHSAIKGDGSSFEATESPSAEHVDESSYLEAPKAEGELGRLGSYRILSKLGEGGMGMVYEAEDTKLRRRIALKVMLPKHAANPTASARFLREARAQAAVEHEHVASIFLVGDDQAVPYIAMPLLKGQTLQAALKANPRPPVNEILRLGQEMAEGLAAAHAIGLIHRDIKPANVWLEGHKRKVKILDFGLARAVAGAEVDVDESEGPKTQQGAMLGTPAYMSPEQARGEELDARSDLFSLGVVLYEMATGERPFKGKDVWGILTSLAVDNPAPPHTKNPAIPESLSAVILKILAKNPVDRPQSGEEIAESLRQIERGVQQMPVAVPMMSAPMVNDPWEDIDATSVGDSTRATVASPMSESATDASPRSPKTKLLIGLGGLLTAIVLGVIVIKITNKDGSVTELKVPEGSKVEAIQGGKTTVVADPRTPKKPVVVAPSRVDYVLRFDGDSETVSVPDIAFDGNSPVTLEGWFTPTTIAGTDHVLRLGKVGSDQLSIRLANNEWHCILSNDANPGIVQYAAAKAKAGRRDHVAGVWDGRELRVYVNGKSFAPTRVEAKIAAKRPQGELAMTYGKSTGIVDEVRISKSVRYDNDFVPQPHFETDKDTLALYHFDEGQGDVLKDSSGNNHHGKITGARWVKVAGASSIAPLPNSRFALDFDGSRDTGVFLPVRYDGSHPFTAEGWVLVNTFAMGDAHQNVIADNSNGGFHLGILNAGPFWKCPIVGKERGATLQPSEKIVANQWTHVALTIDGERAQLFVGGRLLETKDLPGGYKPSGRDITLARFPAGAPLNGKLFEVRLSKSNRYQKDFVPPARFDPDADTLALYHFDEGQGDVLKDSSGNNHHGKITGARWVKIEPVAGEFGLHFDGTNVVRMDKGFDFKNDSYTVEAVVHLERHQSFASIFGISGSENGALMLGGANGDRWQWNHHYAPSGHFSVTADQPALLGKRVHLAGVRDQNDFYLFIDGKLAGVRKANAIVLVSLVKNLPSMGTKLTGTVYGIRVTSKARYLADFVPPVRLKSDADTAALYLFKEGAGDTLEDSSGNGRHGKILGAKWVKAQTASPEPLQADWAAKLKMPVDSTTPTGLAMVVIPPGEGMAKPFLMGKYEVTQTEWEKVMGYNPSSFSKTGKDKDKVTGMDTSQFPVEMVSWFDCMSFCNKLSEKEGYKPYYALKVLKEANGTISDAEVQILGGSGYHLPTVAEWSWACSAGAKTKFHFGSEDKELPQNAWLHDNSDDRSHSVGEKSPNAFGLYDLYGNVNEWNEEQFSQADGSKERVHRGDSWATTQANFTLGNRLRALPGVRYAYLGLRLARVPAVAMNVTGPNVSDVRKQQADWAAKIKMPVELTSPTGIAMVLIPPGEGVEKLFYMGKYEVTQSEWEKVMGYNPSEFGPKNAKVAGLDTSKFPVEKVNWFDCVEFCNKLSEKEGLKPYYELTVTERKGPSIEQAEVKILGGRGYHIPTDAEWTWACAAGAKTRYHFGSQDEDLPEYAWFDQNSGGRTHAVGEKRPNAFGLYDIHGNVREWNEEVLTKGDGAPERVHRGGYWNHSAALAAVSARYRNDPATRNYSFGLRLARVPASEVSLPGDASSDAKKQQAEWASKLKLPVESKSSTGIAMVVIPPGEGVDKPFLMGKYEVTQGRVGKGDGVQPERLQSRSPQSRRHAHNQISRGERELV